MQEYLLKIIFTSFFLLSFSLYAAPFEFSYSGRITDQSGKPIDGPINLSISFYRTESGETSIISPVSFSNVVITEGVFAVTFTEQKISSANLNSIFSASDSVWIEVMDASNGVTYPRQKIGAVPFALKVPVDETTLTYDADGKMKLKNVNNLQGRSVANVDPTTDYVLKWDGAAWSPGAVTSTSGGDMLASVYDTNSNNIVDDAAALEGHAANYFATSGHNHSGVYSASSHAHAGADITSGTVAEARIDAAIARDSEITYKSESDLTTALNDNYANTSHAHSSLNASDGDPTSALFVDAFGNVGIGTTSPVSPLHLLSLNNSLEPVILSTSELTSPTGSAGWTRGIMNSVSENLEGTHSGGGIENLKNQVILDGGGTQPLVVGINQDIYQQGSGQTTDVYGSMFNIMNVGAGTIVNGYGVAISDVQATNGWGIYQTGADDKNYFAGNVGIGTTSPTAKTHIIGTADDEQLIIQGYSSQTANLLEWKDSSGTLLTYIDASGNYKKVCPSNFTSVESQGTQLGCIQNDYEGGAAASWTTALNNCFSTYGGRLPTNLEFSLSYSQYSLTNETNTSMIPVWISEVYYSGYSLSHFRWNYEAGNWYWSSGSDDAYYRCWIPK